MHRILNKSFLTNFIALIIAIIGYFWHQQHLYPIGLYALSGAITNWLAIYMLFERVPFLYGSGVIPKRFEDFKVGIRKLIMEQFFSQQNIERFFNPETLQSEQIDLEPLVAQIDYDQLFDGLVDVIMASSFGGMLTMFGGRDKLTPLREPVKKKFKEVVRSVLQEPRFISSVLENIPLLNPFVINQKVQQMVDQRLAELTPKMVKQIIQDMIREHLGWLVVWGGVFGGIIGFAASFIH